MGRVRDGAADVVALVCKAERERAADAAAGAGDENSVGHGRVLR